MKTRLASASLRIGAGALAAWLAGCAAVGPDRARPAVDAPASWRDWHGGAASLQLPGAADRPATTGERWAALTDPTLTRLLAIAADGNPDIAGASLRILEARTLETTASAQRGPQVAARAGASRQRLSDSGSSTRLVDAIAPSGAERDQVLSFLASPYTVYQAGFDASWELDLWGRVRRSIEAAQAQTEESDATLRGLRLTLAADVVRTYHQWRGLQAQQALLAEQRRAADEAEALLAAQFRGGLVTEQPLLARRQRVADLRSRDDALTLEIASAVNRLTVLCGRHPGALNDVLATPPAGPQPLPSVALGLPADLVRHRPDVAAAEARLAGTTASIGVAVADLYPRITLGASFGFESLHDQELAQWGSRQWSIGPSLSLPVFDHGRRRATVALRELQQQEAAVAFQQTVLKAWHEVDDAASAYASELAQQRTLDDKAALADAAATLAQAQYGKGITDYVPVLDADQAADEVRQARADSAARLRIRLVALYKALGDDGTLPLAPAVASASGR
ncbi:MAG: efflux transporter outer membrane subunit [Proteobacteria bacterium]|nr:efflux transporter outer membrane subunit [Pseudomonadota bacterium]